MLNYFAYGSNMSVSRLSARVQITRLLGVGTLSRHVLRWHKRSKDRSAKCDAFFTGNPENRVFGVLYQIDDSQKSRLDRAEGLGHGYLVKAERIESNNEIVHAVLYVATPEFIDESLKPYDWYKDHVLLGAREHGLPNHYVKRIEAVHAIPDPDAERADRERSIHAARPRRTE